ncbi:MAG: hypothetical protein HQM08_07120 [Candidatus Riflebacteria bacterium]|nr:hypothetical protein [Candidatus Riflebacteria bacterium]
MNINLNSEAVKKLPQKITLIDLGLSWKSLILLILFTALPSSLAVWFFYKSGINQNISIFFCFLMVLIFFILKYFLEKLLYPLLAFYGWFPMIEYIPADDQIILNDSVGFEGLIRADSRYVISLKSLKEIKLRRTSADFFQLFIVTRKNEEIAIKSSLGKNFPLLKKLGERIAVMVSLPFSDENIFTRG